MAMTATAVSDVRRLARPECTTFATVEFARIADLLDDLDDGDWTRPTDCPDWDVRALAGHVLGMVQTFSALTRLLPDLRSAAAAAKRTGAESIDALTDLQVRRNARLDPASLITELRRLGPGQATWRARRRLMRGLPIKNGMPDGTVETWRLGYLVDVILNRDPWMHRIDLSRATGKDMLLTADHDGRLVADVVAEWAQRHGQPFRLTLTGLAGGRWADGAGGPSLELDAIDFCRTVSGRATGVGLLGVDVPF